MTLNFSEYLMNFKAVVLESYVECFKHPLFPLGLVEKFKSTEELYMVAKRTNKEEDIKNALSALSWFHYEMCEWIKLINNN